MIQWCLGNIRFYRNHFQLYIHQRLSVKFQGTTGVQNNFKRMEKKDVGNLDIRKDSSARSHLIEELSSFLYWEKKKVRKLDEEENERGIIGSTEAHPILCVRCARWERERERERDTESDGSDVTIVALKLAMSVHFPLPKSRTFRVSLHTSHLTLLILWCRNSQWVLTFPCQKMLPSLFQLSHVERFFFPSKKWIKLIPKTIGNRKRNCAWGCARGVNTTWENLQIAKHKSGRRFAHRTDLCFAICSFSRVVFIPRVQPHA